jgi:hypothetical protein
VGGERRNAVGRTKARLTALVVVLVVSFARSISQSFARSISQSFARSISQSFARSISQSFARYHSLALN